MDMMNIFDYYFNEDGEEQGGDPNADPNAQAAPPPPPPNILPPSPPPQDEFEKAFPTIQDNTTSEQDVANFTNFQKIAYFKKFEKLQKMCDRMIIQFNHLKDATLEDEYDDEVQGNIVNILLSSIKEIKNQINFFLEKGIVALSMDKIQVIFRAQIRKLNYIIDEFERLSTKFREEMEKRDKAKQREIKKMQKKEADSNN